MSQRKFSITAGCDPEMFLQSTLGELRSSVGLIGGTKIAPQPLPLGDGYAVQEDNVAVEFNIPPAANSMEFINSINKTLAFLTGIVRDNYGMEFSRLSAASFPDDQLMSAAAQEFGCEPDFNCWTGKKNPKPAAEDKNLRSCGGHVHIGFDRKEIDTMSVMKMMDLHLGVPSVLMDKGDLRKQLYGKAGAYRDKSFGGEYRVLSNFWIFEDSLIKWAWDNTERAVNAAGSRLALSNDDEARIINCINTNDKSLAGQLVEQFQLEVA